MNNLNPDEVILFRALMNSGVILLIMLRLARPTGAREIAAILGLDEHTVARRLRSLARLNLVGRTRRKCGYILLDGSQLILGKAATVKNLQLEPIHSVKKLQSCGPIIITTRDNDLKDESVVIIESPLTVKKLQSEALSPTEQALKAAGISNPKRAALARLQGVTPETIQAWEANLKYEKGSSYKPGLLIHMLESGEPAPPVNQNGHHLMCECEACQRSRYSEWNHEV